MSYLIKGSHNQKMSPNWEDLTAEEREAIRKETHETCNEREKREWLAKNQHLPDWVEPGELVGKSNN